jgi:hypothetical protein
MTSTQPTKRLITNKNVEKNYEQLGQSKSFYNLKTSFGINACKLGRWKIIILYYYKQTI